MILKGEWKNAVAIIADGITQTDVYTICWAIDEYEPEFVIVSGDQGAVQAVNGFMSDMVEGMTSEIVGGVVSYGVRNWIHLDITPQILKGSEIALDNGTEVGIITLC